MSIGYTRGTARGLKALKRFFEVLMPVLLSFHDLSRHLEAWCGIRLTKRRVLQWRCDGLPVVVLGPRTIRYDPLAVEKWILQHGQATEAKATEASRVEGDGPKLFADRQEQA